MSQTIFDVRSNGGVESEGSEESPRHEQQTIVVPEPGSLCARPSRHDQSEFATWAKNIPA